MPDPVLVVGAGGFVGRSLLGAMAGCGIPVFAMGGGAAGTAPAPHLRSIPARLGDVDGIAPLLARVGAVVHLASASTPGASAGKPLLELEGNLRPTLALLEALQAHPQVHLVYVSSGGTLLHRADDGTDDGGPVLSRSYYGAGKLAAEHFIEAWCHQYSASATVLRPSNLYGPGQQERPGFGVIPTALGKVARGEVFEIWGDGSASRDYLYIDDFIRLLLGILDAPPSRGCRVFNAASGRSTSLDELLRLIECATGRPLRRSHVPGRRVDAPAVHMQSDRARTAFGWAAEVGLEEGIDRTWRWFTDFRR